MNGRRYLTNSEMLNCTCDKGGKRPADNFLQKSGVVGAWSNDAICRYLCHL